MIIGDSNMWTPLFPEGLVSQILDLVWDTWVNFPPPSPDESEVPLTRRFKHALKQAKDFRRLPIRIERESSEDDPTTGAELGRLDLKLCPAASAVEEVYFAFECKRLFPVEQGKCRSRASEYVTLGMMRFTSGRYGAAMQHGGMIGYVMKGDVNVAIATVQRMISRHGQQLYLEAGSGLHASTYRPHCQATRESSHMFPPARRFRLHHIFLGIR